uniref:Uncharacterized protein n=1 Tax=Knipowitschia caucasica TaxID=637954 RepID=A0AAV2MQH1_KNICA
MRGELTVVMICKLAEEENPGRVSLAPGYRHKWTWIMTTGMYPSFDLGTWPVPQSTNNLAKQFAAQKHLQLVPLLYETLAFEGIGLECWGVGRGGLGGGCMKVVG